MRSLAPTPRRRHTQTLRGTLASLLPAVLLTLVFVGVGIIHVTSRVLVVDAGYRLSRLQSAQGALTMENDRLKLELATLKNPARLEKYARTQLRLGPPAPTALLSPGRVISQTLPPQGTVFATARAPLKR